MTKEEQGLRQSEIATNEQPEIAINEQSAATTNERPEPIAAPRKASFMTARELAVSGLLAGITVLLGVTGYGFIHLIYMKATILHIPTIIGAIAEGPRVGMTVGFLFGCFSLMQNVMVPTLMSIVFLNPLISVLPRLLLGLIAYVVYRVLPGKAAVRIAISALVTSMSNTVMVMGLTYLLYAKEFAEIRQIPLDRVIDIIITICVMNGIPEAIGAAVIATPIIVMLQRTRRGARK